MTLDLRQTYDIGQRVNESPVIYVCEEFLQADEITELIATARSNLQRAVVSDAKTGAVSPGRTNQNCWVSHHQTEAIGGLCDRIASLIGLPLSQAESLQVIHYNETQEYRPHYDAWDASTERGKRCMAQGGQRLVTCLLYLNTVTEGGGTCFPHLDLEVRAIQGRLLIFHNCEPGTNLRHPDSLHGGQPVLQGEKWACNLWFRERSYRQAPPPRPSGFKRVI